MNIYCKKAGHKTIYRELITTLQNKNTSMNIYTTEKIQNAS